VLHEVIPDDIGDEGDEFFVLVGASSLPHQRGRDVARDHVVPQVEVFRVREGGGLLVEVVAQPVHHEEPHGAAHPVGALPAVEGLRHVRAHDPRELVARVGREEVLPEQERGLAADRVDRRSVDDLEIAGPEPRVPGQGAASHLQPVLGGHQLLAPGVLPHQQVPDLVDVRQRQDLQAQGQVRVGDRVRRGAQQRHLPAGGVPVNALDGPEHGGGEIDPPLVAELEQRPGRLSDRELQPRGVPEVDEIRHLACQIPQALPLAGLSEVSVVAGPHKLPEFLGIHRPLRAYRGSVRGG
jgi:hypothetical protein